MLFFSRIKGCRNPKYNIKQGKTTLGIRNARGEWGMGNGERGTRDEG